MIGMSLLLYAQLLTTNEIPFLFGSATYILSLAFVFTIWIVKEGLVDIR